MGGFGKRAWKKQKRILKKVRSMKGARKDGDNSTASKAQQRENAERLKALADDLLGPEYVSKEEQQNDENIKEITPDATDSSAKDHRKDINRRWR